MENIREEKEKEKLQLILLVFKEKKMVYEVYSQGKRTWKLDIEIVFAGKFKSIRRDRMVLVKETGGVFKASERRRAWRKVIGDVRGK